MLLTFLTNFQQQQQYPKPTYTRGSAYRPPSTSHYPAATTSHYPPAATPNYSATTSNYPATPYTSVPNYAPPATQYTNAGAVPAVHYPPPVRSTLGYQPRPAYSAAPAYSAGSAPPHRFVVSHKPAPNLTQIALTPTDNPAGNLRPGKHVQRI